MAREQATYRLALIASALWLTLLLVGTVAAQSSYQSSAYGFGVSIPAGWQLGDEIDVGDELLVTFMSPAGNAVLVAGATILDAEELEGFEQHSLDAFTQEAFEGVQENLPGAQATRVYDLSVSGLSARGFDFEAQGVAGSLIFFVDSGTLYTLMSAADAAGSASAQAAFEALRAGFTRIGTDAAGELGGGGVAGGGAGGGLGLVTADPFTGTFRDERVTLRLEGAAGRYSGELHFQGQTFPVTAQGVGNQLSGTFTSGGTPFAFSATLSGGTLTFVTGGTSYHLQR